MTIVGIILIILGILLIIFNHYHPTKNYPQTIKFIAYLLIIIGLVLFLWAIINFFRG